MHRWSRLSRFIFLGEGQFSCNRRIRTIASWSIAPSKLYHRGICPSITGTVFPQWVRVRDGIMVISGSAISHFFVGRGGNYCLGSIFLVPYQGYVTCHFDNCLNNINNYSVKILVTFTALFNVLSWEWGYKLMEDFLMHFFSR